MLPGHRGYLVTTEAGRARLKEGGMEGAYLGDDGRVHIPGKRVTLYSDPSPPRPDKLVCTDHVTKITGLNLYIFAYFLGSA